jgi:transposase
VRILPAALSAILADRNSMAYKVAAIDVHKMVLIVAVAKAADEVKDPVGEALEFECRRFGATAQERTHLIAWLEQRGVTEVVMESTAQYWKPVWLDLEPHFPKLHLAQAHSNKAPKGRKNDYKDAKRLARRLLAGELMLSFVPPAEQRVWRELARAKEQYVQERVRVQNRIESQLEEMRIKLSGVISDLLGVSGRRILTALAEGETDPAKLAELGDERLKCSRELLIDALRGSPTPVQLQILKLHLEMLGKIDSAIGALDKLLAEELKKHEEAVVRLAEVPGLGVDSAQRLIAEIGVDAEAFPSADEFASWFGGCPGSNISAEENHGSGSPKGNRYVRKLLTQAAQAAVKKKGSIFQSLFRRFLPRLTYKGAIWAIAHRIGRLAWKILHQGVAYIEKGEETTPQARKRRRQKLTQALRKLGYAVALTPLNPGPQPALEG